MDDCHVHDAEAVQARIQDLDLDRRFDAVLLLSHLIEVPDDGLRRAFLRTCRRHVRADGSVLLQRQPSGWFDTVAPAEQTIEGVALRLREVHRPRPGVVEAVMEYEADGMTWTQCFSTRRLDDRALDQALAEADLAVAEYLSPDQGWIRAVPR